MNDPSPAIAVEARPRLPRGVRLVHNEAQGGWVLLAPERVFKADQIAVEIIKRCTGEATFGEIVDDLASTFGAPRERSWRTPAPFCVAWPTNGCWNCDILWRVRACQREGSAIPRCDQAKEDAEPSLVARTNESGGRCTKASLT